MGNSPPPKNAPKINKMDFEIKTLKIKGYLELQRDRRKNDIMTKEKLLIQMCNQATRNKLDEVHKVSSIISDSQFVEACDIVIRYCDVLKDRSMVIVNCQGNPQQIEELMPCIESVIWATKPLNIACLQEFSNMMLYFFGQQQINVDQSQKVDPDLRKCFQNIMPTKTEINNYLFFFAERSGLGLEVINRAGHNVVDPKVLEQMNAQPVYIQPQYQPGQQIMPPYLQQQPPFNNNNGNNGQQGGPFGGGGQGGMGMGMGQGMGQGMGMGMGMGGLQKQPQEAQVGGYYVMPVGVMPVYQPSNQGVQVLIPQNPLAQQQQQQPHMLQQQPQQMNPGQMFVGQQQQQQQNPMMMNNIPNNNAIQQQQSTAQNMFPNPNLGEPVYAPPTQGFQQQQPVLQQQQQQQMPQNSFPQQPLGAPAQQKESNLDSLEERLKRLKGGLD